MSTTKQKLGWLILGVFLVVLLSLTFNKEAHAQSTVIRTVGDVTDPDSFDANYNAQGSVTPDDALAHTLGSVEFFMADNGATDPPRLRVRNITTATWLDCYSEYVDYDLLPDYSAGNYEIGEVYGVNFSGTECSMTAGEQYFAYMVTDSNPTNTSYSNIYFMGEITNGEASSLVYDGPLPPDPATSDSNEVLRYIYDPDLNNNFGTSTIGAEFSIAHPDWIDFVGVSLASPSGTVVWTSSTTVATSSTFSITTEYGFNESGVYLLAVVWAQTVNGTQNITINPTVLRIPINVPNWQPDPVTGNLINTASTTIATSTLNMFRVDCPDSFIVGDLCKVIVGFVIPNYASIQNLQSSFSNLLTKAPFSFFTESKLVMEAVRTGVSGGSQYSTLSLTFFGVTSDVISTSTLESIGVGTTEINFFKSLMVVGMWILLAWYLYWRIASIFGV